MDIEKISMDFGFPPLLHVGFFLQFSALFTGRGIVGFWSKWVGGGTAIALGLQS